MYLGKKEKFTGNFKWKRNVLIEKKRYQIYLKVDNMKICNFNLTDCQCFKLLDILQFLSDLFEMCE